MADLSVIHGGQGTVYTACLAGAPIVGVAFQPEQEGNLKCLVRKGIAILIRRKEFTVGAILDAMDKLLNDDEAKCRAVEFKEIVESWDGPANARDFLKEKFGD